MKLLFAALVSSVCVYVAAQSPGNGISKSTYTSNDPITGYNFLYKYFPVATPGDECDNNICICPAVGAVPQWYIQQGRVYTKMTADDVADTGRDLLQSPGLGFGLHLVNVSNHLTTGGMSTAAVEAEFTKKMGDMAEFDSFMDYNAALYTSDLDTYTTNFDNDKVPYLLKKWSYDNKTYHSCFVQVPGSQMILELYTDAAGTFEQKQGIVQSVHPRISPYTAKYLGRLNASASLLYPTSVNRAVSDILSDIKDFYVTGMKTTQTSDITSSEGQTACYLWTGATVEICFTHRPDNATKGDFKPKDFETMLHTVHSNLLKNPQCGVDKWFDNHYAIDSMTADTSNIVSYIAEKKTSYYCTNKALHYVFDPTGWGIQLDVRLSTQPPGCSTVDESHSLFANLTGTFNPACIPGTCS